MDTNYLRIGLAATLALLGTCAYASSVVVSPGRAEADFVAAFPSAKSIAPSVRAAQLESGVSVVAAFGRDGARYRLGQIEKRIAEPHLWPASAIQRWKAERKSLANDLSSGEIKAKGSVSSYKCNDWYVTLSGDKVPQFGVDVVRGTASVAYVGQYPPFPPLPPPEWALSAFTRTTAFAVQPGGGVQDVYNEGYAQSGSLGVFDSIAASSASSCGTLGCVTTMWATNWIVESGYDIDGCGMGYIEFMGTNYP